MVIGSVFGFVPFRQESNTVNEFDCLVHGLRLIGEKFGGYFFTSNYGACARFFALF
jgi:hypothetical protein